MLKVEKELLQEMESLGFKKVEGGTEWFHTIKTKNKEDAQRGFMRCVR